MTMKYWTPLKINLELLLGLSFSFVLVKQKKGNLDHFVAFFFYETLESKRRKPV